MALSAAFLLSFYFLTFVSDRFMYCHRIDTYSLIFYVKCGVVVSSLELLTYLNSDYMTTAGLPRSMLLLVQRDY